jgi:HEPN domain-containing protein
MKKSKEEVQLITDWLRLAQENLQVASSTITAEYSPYHTVCFLCQNSAERYLKAYLIYQGWELKKTHDLNELLAFCVEYNNSLETLRDDCEILNEYITSARYPGDLPFDNFDEDQAKEAIASANRISETIQAEIKLQSPEEPASPKANDKMSSDMDNTSN